MLPSFLPKTIITVEPQLQISHSVKQTVRAMLLRDTDLVALIRKRYVESINVHRAQMRAEFLQQAQDILNKYGLTEENFKDGSWKNAKYFQYNDRLWYVRFLDTEPLDENSFTMNSYHLTDSLATVLDNIPPYVVDETGTKYTTNLARKLKKEFNYKIPNKVKEYVGNYVTKMCTKQTYFVDFANRARWGRNDFGQSSSCWWTTNYVRYMPTDKVLKNTAPKTEWFRCGGFAIRQWPDATMDYGIGRCWILPVGNEDYILFNAYSRTLQDNGFASIYASILSSITKEEYTVQKVDHFQIVHADDRYYSHAMFYLNTRTCPIVTKKKTGVSALHGVLSRTENNFNITWK